ncbi:MAG: DUF1826 domain-containing protein [Pseudomonadota bacterium]
MSTAPDYLKLVEGLDKSRKASVGDQPSIFTDIFKEDINIAIWRRALSAEIKDYAQVFLKAHKNYRQSLVVKPDNAFEKLTESESKLSQSKALCQNISELVEMFCLLFGVKQVGLRLTTLDHSMCPRFHVDRVPGRLVCTYHGVSTEWLPHNEIDRSKLGNGNNGLPDEESGLFQSPHSIKQLNVGDVAILKGELWDGNENAGLVHRSPQVPSGENRLLLTLDFLS